MNFLLSLHQPIGLLAKCSHVLKFPVLIFPPFLFKQDYSQPLKQEVIKFKMFILNENTHIGMTAIQ